MGRQTLSTRGNLRLTQAIAHAEELMEQLKSGSVYIVSGKEQAWLNVPNNVNLALDAKCKDEKGSSNSVGETSRRKRTAWSWP